MKAKNLNDCVITIGTTNICALCGREIADVDEGCTCNQWASVVRNLGLIDASQSQIDKYQRIADEQRANYEANIEMLLNRMPEIRFAKKSVETVVSLPSTPEPPAEEDGGNGDNEEPTEGGGE